MHSKPCFLVHFLELIKEFYPNGLFSQITALSLQRGELHTLAFSSRHLTKAEVKYCLRWWFSSCNLASSSSFCTRVSWSCKKQTMVKAALLCWLCNLIIMPLIPNLLKLFYYFACFMNSTSGSPPPQRPKFNLHPPTTWLFSFVLWIFYSLLSVWRDYMAFKIVTTGESGRYVGKWVACNCLNTEKRV